MAATHLFRALRVRPSLLLLFSLTSTVSMVMSQTACPAEKCTCTGQRATCQGVTGTVRFPDEVTSVTITESSDLVLDRDSFGKYTEDLEVTQSHIKTIDSGAFSDTTALRSVLFSGVKITSVKTCAFSKIKAPARIVFDTIDIQTVESGAFSDVSMLSSILFKGSVVNELKPYAFFVVQADQIAFHDSDVNVLHPRAFYSIAEVKTFEIVNVTSKTVDNNAFTEIRAIEKVTIRGCAFTDVKCASLVPLYFGTPFPHSTFSFTDSMVRCSCSTLPLINFIRSNADAVAESVTCAATPSSMEQKVPLAIASTAKICQEENTEAETCGKVEPEFPECPAIASGRTSSTPATIEGGSTQGGGQQGGTTQAQGGNTGSKMAQSLASWASLSFVALLGRALCV